MTQHNEGLFSWETIQLQLRIPFRLSYGASEQRQAHWIRMRGNEGWGEGTIPPYYNISRQSMLDYWQKQSERLDPLPESFNEIRDWLDPDGPAPARAAIDLALHDYISRKQGLPLYSALGLKRPEPKTSCFTISVDTPEAMAAEALRVNKFPIIKLKLAGDDQDMERLEAVRAARPGARLLVDANAGWSQTQAKVYLKLLERFEVELLEQPLGLSELEGMGSLQALTSIPIVADESVRTLQDVKVLQKAGVRGINIKLMKVGGLTPALEMIRWAKGKNMQIMLGCMIETSIGLTAMAHLSGFADWLDLDASLLVTNDPFVGMVFDENAVIHVPEKPGLGIILRG
jgi:L-alanine-DL-glutamate epimerase-like enolase superfamily enzyme